ncbi:hypothetical protein PoB_001330400 [Plakobranchus ocellatus]|uniref:Uncharacterized protein n=1 Tax=Plakobranchus ocellatus TaxID=259542 RepID=A0AAV3YYH7_9GAST|nr:hypothetical protein PoB_001330400 [Plakobranchus ocellatus]
MATLTIKAFDDGGDDADDADGASPQQGDLRLSGPPSGQGVSGGARTRDRGIPADIRADSIATVPPTPHNRRELTYSPESRGLTAATTNTIQAKLNHKIALQNH